MIADFPALQFRIIPRLWRALTKMRTKSEVRSLKVCMSEQVRISGGAEADKSSKNAVTDAEDTVLRLCAARAMSMKTLASDESWKQCPAAANC